MDTGGTLTITQTDADADVTDGLGMLIRRTKDGAVTQWYPTMRFRWQRRDVAWTDGHSVHILQQFWSAVPAAQGEWRDVPTAAEGDAHG